jgi:hypothetical protein
MHYHDVVNNTINIYAYRENLDMCYVKSRTIVNGFNYPTVSIDTLIVNRLH